MKRENGAQIAPCIISKVRDAFFGANNFNRNKKQCSNVYWNEVCEKLGALLNKSLTEINHAQSKFSSYNSR